MKIKAVYDFLDFIAPFNTAAQWDNCGLSVGSLNNEVTKLVVALDVTEDVINKAKEVGAELVVTHHPLIFDPVKAVESDSILYKAIQSGITFISTHTCLDKAVGGVNYCLARLAGIKNIKDCHSDEFLKIGEIEPCSADEYALKLKEALGGMVTYTESEKLIKKVAFCSGSGGDLVGAARSEGADALLTGEAKHHEYLEAKNLGVALFSAGHYETEEPVCDYLRRTLKVQFDDVEVINYSGDKPVKYI